MKRMKKLTAALTAAILTAAFPFAVCAEAVRLGDVDADGIVDRADAALLGQYLSGDAELTDEGMLNADMNADGNVDAEDLEQLSAYESALCIAESGTGAVTTVQDPENYSPWFTDEQGNTYSRGTNASLSTYLVIEELPQTSFLLGEAFSTEGLKVFMVNQRTWTTVTYDVSDQLCIYTDYDADTPGTYTVKVYTDYSGYQASTDEPVSYEVTVAADGTAPWEETDITTTVTTVTTGTTFSTETTTMTTPGTAICSDGWQTTEMTTVVATTQYVEALVDDVFTLVIMDPPANATVTEVISSNEKIVELYEIDYYETVISIHTVEQSAGYAYVLATLSTGEKYLFFISVNDRLVITTSETIGTTTLPGGSTATTTTTVYTTATGGYVTDENGDPVVINGTTAVYSQTSAKESEVRGDADGDGGVRLADAIQISKASAGVEGFALTAQGKLNADLDGDGEITSKDLDRILKFLVGSLKTL